MKISRASTPFPDGRMPEGTNEGPPPLHTELSLANYETLSAPKHILHSYHLGFSRVFDLHAAYLSWFEEDQIRQPRYALAVALEDSTVTAGFYYKMHARESGVHLEICGMYSNSRRKGLVSLLLAKTAFLESRRCQMDVSAEAAVRVMPLPGGESNEASALTLARAGFYPRRFFQAPIKGTPEDQHLALSSDGSAYLGVVMYAKPSDLRRRSEEVLHELGLLEALR